MKISCFFYLKVSFVHLARLNTIGSLVFMLITGKILKDLLIDKFFVRIAPVGIFKKRSITIKTVVKMAKIVKCAMVGKNTSITWIIIKNNNVKITNVQD